MSFSPDGGRLASTGYDFAMHLWDPGTGLEVFSVRDLPTEGFDVRADRPYLVVLTEKHSDATLFMALVRDPSTKGQ